MKPESTLAKKINIRFHVAAIIGCFLFALVFEKLTGREFFSDSFLFIYLMMLVQVEIFRWIGIRMFGRLQYNSVKEFKRSVLVQLGKFYLFVLLIGFCIFVLTGVLMSLKRGYNPMEFIRNIPRYELKGFMTGAGIGLIIGSFIYFIAELLRAVSLLQKLQEEKLQYQYQTLKNQVNPHFLFNSLNTLSTLVHTNADAAEQFIQRMASTYRYILDNNENRLVTLQEELKFVSEYFYLNQLRGQGKLELVTDENIPQMWKVLPVSLQLLVENALKHNAATKEAPLLIRIRMSGDFVEVINNKRPVHLLEKGTGIGLKNLAERIRNVTGRELIIEEGSDYFSVKLPVMK